MEYRSCMKKDGTKRGQKQQIWAKPRGGTGTTIQNPFGTDTNTSGTGTTLHNVFGTDTKHSGTGTTTSKMPIFL